MLRRFMRSVLCLVSLMTLHHPSWAFDRSHAAFTEILGQVVTWNAQGTSTTVDYPGLASLRPELEQYLRGLSTVDPHSFEDWNKHDQLAFLINAYNGFTLKLILDHYPVDSIKDIGHFWQSPWELEFFTLLGKHMHLDHLEHAVIRNPQAYGDPRIHFAVNCASVGCPALRHEAYTGSTLDQRLEDQTWRFLADKTRNRLTGGILEVSPIFKWYREDFERPWRGSSSLEEFLLLYAGALNLSPKERRDVRQEDITIKFTSYDWRLNRS
jgi:hypothetical protein